MKIKEIRAEELKSGVKPQWDIVPVVHVEIPGWLARSKGISGRNEEGVLQLGSGYFWLLRETRKAVFVTSHVAEGTVVNGWWLPKSQIQIKYGD